MSQVLWERNEQRTFRNNIITKTNIWTQVCSSYTHIRNCSPFFFFHSHRGIGIWKMLYTFAMVIFHSYIYASLQSSRQRISQSFKNSRCTSSNKDRWVASVKVDRCGLLKYESDHNFKSGPRMLWNTVYMFTYFSTSQLGRGLGWYISRCLPYGS